MKKLVYFVVLILSYITTQAQTTYPIVWSNPINVNVNADNTLTKAGGVASTFDSGAASENLLLPNTDGYIQFTYSGTGNTYMIALSRLNVSPSYTLSDYNFHIFGSSLKIYLGSADQGITLSLVAGDILKIAREGGVINFYKNTTVVKTITLANTNDPLRADVSIHTGTIPVVRSSFTTKLTAKSFIVNPGVSNNNGIINIQLENGTNPVNYTWSSGETASVISSKSRGAYTVNITDGGGQAISRTYNLGYPVSWTNLSNISVNADNSLTKTDADGWGTSGASSLNVLPANTDGWIEFVVNEPGAEFIIGLSRIDNGFNRDKVNYGWFVNTSGGILIYEMNTNAGFSAGIMKGDIFRIERQGTFIRYYLNGQMKREVTDVPYTTTFLIDVGAATKNASLPVVTASFDKKIRVLPSITLPDASSNTSGSIALNIQGSYPPQNISWSSGETSNIITDKNRGSYTVTVNDALSNTFTRTYRAGYPVEWADLQNTSVTVNNTLIKTAGGDGAWNAGAISSNVLPPSTDGWVECVMPSGSIDCMFGLARMNNVVLYQRIDYAFYFSEGNVLVYEWGTSKGIVATQEEGAVYTIAREGSNVKYYINGEVVRTVAANTSYQLFVDVSLRSGIFPLTTVSFTRTPQTYYAIANGDWTQPNTWSLSEGGTPATLYPSSSDEVQIKGYTVTLASGITSLGVNITAINENTCLKIEGASAVLRVKGNVVIKGENNTTTSRALLVQNNGKINVQNP
ncbi:hypothetical protein [Chryseosolibacter indicus]|uniref:Ig-like domain-containing protein n=1 Tax=Chryseosolibacter indicus TaxID=2782351 RepID=A0ABS5VYH4_9BACT|nr:hypothetical protein [Chryseosolibacter indicus]MBT1706465.1 hypothetical protein [Chryseosolibacter indicus]